MHPELFDGLQGAVCPRDGLALEARTDVIAIEVALCNEGGGPILLRRTETAAELRGVETVAVPDGARGLKTECFPTRMPLGLLREKIDLDRVLTWHCGCGPSARRQAPSQAVVPNGSIVRSRTCIELVKKLGGFEDLIGPDPLEERRKEDGKRGAHDTNEQDSLE